MKRVIIRDDDISYFTRPEQLEKVYGHLWEAGKPVSFAVIPAQQSNVRVLHRPGRPYDPSIAPPYRGIDQQHAITDNPDLCQFLNARAREGLAEICLHGFDHSYMEFDQSDPNVLHNKLKDGLLILQDAIPDASIQTFIAPYDKLSVEALNAVIEMNFNLCTASINLDQVSALAEIGPYEMHEWADGRALYTCDEYLFTHRQSPALCLATARKRIEEKNLLIVANHYWTFFYDWHGDNPGLRARWNAFVDDLLNRNDVKFTRFSN